MRRTVCASAALCGLVMTVTACGSSSSSPAASPSSSASAPSTGSAATGEPIRIGELSPINAPFYDAPDEVAAVKAAIASINADGGVNGRPLQLDFCNESNDPNKAAACARGFVSNGDVATIGSITVTANDTVNSILKNGGIANVNYGALSASEFQATNNFPFDGTAPFAGAGLSGIAVKTQGAKKVAIVRNDLPSTVPQETLVKNATAAAGGTYVGNVLLPVTAIPDYSTYAQKLIGTHADFAMLQLGKAQETGIINAVRQLGSSMKLGTYAGAFSDNDLKQLGSNADGLLVWSPNPWIHDAADYPGINDFLTSMSEEKARGDKDADVANGRPFLVKDWLSVYALRQVLEGIAKSGKTIDKTSVLAAFGSAKDLSLMNAAQGTWSPSVKQTVVPQYANVSNTRGYLLKVQNGQQVLAQKDPIDAASFLK